MPKRFWSDMPEVKEELESGFEQKLSAGTAAEIKQSLADEKSKQLFAEMQEKAVVSFLHK